VPQAARADFVVHCEQEWAHWYIKHMVEGGVKLAHLCAEGSGEDDPNCLWKTQRAEEHDIVKLAQTVCNTLLCKETTAIYLLLCHFPRADCRIRQQGASGVSCQHQGRQGPGGLPRR
jgi:hypothetical protein